MSGAEFEDDLARGNLLEFWVVNSSRTELQDLASSDGKILALFLALLPFSVLSGE